MIGLGSNLGDSLAILDEAVAALDALADCHVSRRSPNYRSDPMGPPGQPDYINGVVALETTLRPLELLKAMQQIELDQGRVRSEHWGPRTLDLDLLLYGDQIINHPDLTVPHPGIAERSFVLWPLMDIDPNCEIPGLGRITRLAACVPGDDLERLG